MTKEFQIGDKVRVNRNGRAHHGEEGVIVGFPSKVYIDKGSPGGIRWQDTCKICTVRLNSGTEIMVPSDELEEPV